MYLKLTRSLFKVHFKWKLLSGTRNSVETLTNSSQRSFAGGPFVVFRSKRHDHTSITLMYCHTTLYTSFSFSSSLISGHNKVWNFHFVIRTFGLYNAPYPGASSSTFPTLSMFRESLHTVITVWYLLKIEMLYLCCGTFQKQADINTSCGSFTSYLWLRNCKV